MFEAVASSYLVDFDGGFKRAALPTRPPEEGRNDQTNKKVLAQRIEELSELQEVLYAYDRYAVLLIFQAMDAAGKDSTIRAVMSGVDPAGCQVFSFKQPSAEELDHDFLWRTARALPERGRIGIFNRSYYEEVLAARLHPEYLEAQRLPGKMDGATFWKHRFESICDHELHLARSGTVILKFWLNVSKEEQRQRFLSRLDKPEKNWKFSAGDVREREHWDAYMDAYEQALNETSRPWAPWYAIPADDKRYMRACVADIIVRSLQSLNLQYPKVNQAEHARFAEMRRVLESE
jgi:PPK2 family polyphosphate:nucleotide phosphotransferase